jgi:hypothetical protein
VVRADGRYTVRAAPWAPKPAEAGAPSGGTAVARPVSLRAAVALGLSRIVALYYRAPASYQIHEHIRRRYFWDGFCD